MRAQPSAQECGDSAFCEHKRRRSTCKQCSLDPGQLELYCKCQKTYDGRQVMVGCDECDGWFHLTCEGLQYAPEGDKPYACTTCKCHKEGM